jgi:sulfonate transport system substrate-binding protein
VFEAIDRRALLIGGGLLLAGCGPLGLGARKLRVSVVGKGDGDTEVLLRTAGIKTPGFTVDYANFDSGHLVLEAFDGRALDYGGVSEIPPIFAAATATTSFRQIAVAHGDVNNQVILVPRGSPINDLADLKGKRVGYVRATTSHYFLIRMLQSVGLTWADITPVAMNIADGEAAFSSGRLDAWAIYGFPIQRAVATEGARILKTALGFLSGNYLVAAHVDALADPVKSDLIGRYLRVTRQAYAWAAAHQDQWAAVVAGQIGVPLAYVQDQFHRKSATYSLRPVNEAAIASQQAVADVFARAKLIPKAVDVRPLWDDRFNAIIEEKA